MKSTHGTTCYRHCIYLIHEPEIISHALFPSGQLIEEAQNARNKDFKKFGELHSRKCSRIKSNTDVFNFFFSSSDPLITGIRNLPKKKKLSTLLKEASNHVDNSDHDDNSEDSSDDDHEDDSENSSDDDHEADSEDSDDY